MEISTDGQGGMEIMNLNLAEFGDPISSGEFEDTPGEGTGVGDLNNQPPVTPTPPVTPEPTPAPVEGAKVNFKQLATVYNRLLGQDFYNPEEIADDTTIDQFQALTKRLQQQQDDIRIKAKSEELDNQLEEIRKATAEELGYTPEQQRVLKLWDAGIPMSATEPLGKLRSVSSIPLAASTDTPEAKLQAVENQKQVLRAVYTYQGSDPKLVEAAIANMETQGTLEATAKQMQGRIPAEIERSLTEMDEMVKAKQRQDEEKRTKSMQTFISSFDGKIGNLELSDQEKAKLAANLYEKTKSQTIQGPTGKQVRKYTKVEDYFMTKFHENPKAMAIVSFLVENDFDLNKLTGAAARDTSLKLEDELNRLTSKGGLESFLAGIPAI